MDRQNRQTWSAATAVILTVVGTTWWTGRRMIAVVRTLLCPARDYGRDGRVFRCNGAVRGVRIPLRPGALVTAGDVCHLHPARAAAERCGALMGGPRIW